MKKEQYQAVRRMQRYIQDHLHQPMSLHQLAEVANYSLWHAMRMFREATGKTPFAYIRDLRLARAALALRDSNETVLETALDFHFDSHEGFTRAFTKAFGLPPKHYRKKQPPIPLFYPYMVQDVQTQIQERKSQTMEKSNTIFTQVIQKPRRKLIILRGKKATEYFEYCDEVGCDIWGELLSFKGTLTEPAGYWLPPSMRNGQSTYVQGVEVPLDYEGIIPDKYDVIEFDEGYYMIFQGEPYPEDESTFMVKIRELQEAIQNYQPELYGYVFDESMPKFQFEPQGERGYIEGRPVKPIKKGVFTK